MFAVLATAFATAIPATGAESGSEAELGSQKIVEEGKFDSYIVVMKADPLVVTEGRDNLDTKKANNRGKALKQEQDQVLEDAGVSTTDKTNEYVNALNGFSALITYDEALAIAADSKVAMVIPDELRQPTTDSSPTFIGLDGPAGPWSTGYDGEGVVVGVIDSGIWPEHPSFADDGSYPTPSILPLDGGTYPACDFGNVGHNVDDAPFACNNKLIGARQVMPTYRLLIGADPDEFDSARDDNGHGTHTASTAAGNADVVASVLGSDPQTISGIAPRAHVIAYKGLGNLGGFGSDLAAAIDQAVADGVDVINYSIGGGASLAGADDIAFLFAATAGVFAATSAGNSGPGPNTVGGPGSVPWITTVGANTQPRFFQGTVTLGDDDTYPGASITQGVSETTLVDAADHGGDLCVPGTLGAGVAGTVVLCRRGAIARAAKSLAVFQAGGVGMVMYNNSDDDNLFTDTHWVPSVHIDNTPGLAIKGYIASEGASATASITTGDVTTWDSAPSITIFSSRGPNGVAPDIIKPDITGPGHQILAGNSPFPDPGSVPGELFQSIAGTSMSSPHIAGVFALIKQAHPDWSAAMAKSAIMTTAHQDVVDNDRSTPADPFEMGAGHVDPGNKVHKGSAFQPGLVYDAGLFEYAAFTCGADLGVFTPGSCVFLDNIGIPSDASDLNLPSIAVAELAGSQTVTRTVTSVTNENGWRTFDVSVEAPDGYTVSVSPSTIKLKRGDSATYEVTISNDAGPAGEWRFGSLTWSDRTGHYDVRSPIAVNAARFGSPPLVTGSGESGTTSFDVGFGYTGPYTAAAHGLAENASVGDSVGQDPDQSYPSVDDAYPGVIKHDFVVSGSLFLRWSLAIPGPDDIDLFLEDSGGNIIATSTNGGTNELIELTLPADDTYTMVVHGWLIPSAPLPYTLNFWDVPLAGGGSLVIDSAPASATEGTVGTLDLSWTGAVPGINLGIVSHDTGAGVEGLTFVEVNG